MEKKALEEFHSLQRDDEDFKQTWGNTDSNFEEWYKDNYLERGEASILIELKNGDITVWHGTEDKEHLTPLLEVKNAKRGSWDKIWETLRSLNDQSII